MQVISLNTKVEDRTKFERLLNALKNNAVLIILASALIFGKLCGCLSIKYIDDSFGDYVKAWFSSSFAFKSSSSFWSLLISAFLKSFAFILVISFSAFGVSGIVITPATLFLRGLGTGAISGMLYRDFSLQGIAYSNLLLLPSSFAFDLVLVALGCKALKLSNQFTSIYRNSDFEIGSLKVDSLEFLKSVLFFVFVILLIASGESLFSIGFSEYFNFAF